MCQLNLYGIRKNIPIQCALDIFKVNGFLMEEDNHNCLIEYRDKYNFYSTIGKCDCGSVVSMFRDSNCNTICEYIYLKNLSDKERTRNIELKKSEKDFDNQYQKYIKERDLNSQKLDKLAEHVREFESNELSRIMSKEISHSAKYAECKKLSLKVEKMYRDVEESCEYQDIYEQNRKWSEENQVFIDIEFDFIRNRSYFSVNYVKEAYDKINRLLYYLLKATNDVLIYPFWIDNNKLEIKGKEVISYKNFTAEDIVFLKYNHLLIATN